MTRSLPLVALFLAVGPVSAHGLLIPDDKAVPPLAMLRHEVTVAIEDQVAVTRVEQTFRNHTARDLEATYLFPVPRGASVTKLSMWINDKEVPGELVEAAKAREIYTTIVRRTQDPALLEYVGNDLLSLRVFPVPAEKDQKIAICFTSVAGREGGVIEYIYPLKTDGKATRTLEKFSLELSLKSQTAVQSIYSPTHAVVVERKNDREAKAVFQQQQALLDKDFRLLYTFGQKDVGLTALVHRPAADEDGHFLLMLSPRAEWGKDSAIGRDVVFVLDTSGSMAGEKIVQAQKALTLCLGSLTSHDRFALLNFATTVNHFQSGLVEAGKEQRERGIRWVRDLRATGGTAINEALLAALELRPRDDSRPFTVVFFTDGEPTVGETKPEVIVRNVMARNTTNTRIFTFGVGDDVNATLLDQLAGRTCAASTYVRPHEDIEVKTSGLWDKISQPVLVDLKLSASQNVQLNEMYPTRLPDLFHGGQVLVLGRYKGDGRATITLEGSVGRERRAFTYEVEFPAKSGEEQAFVENLWARRKIGYLLDQIRANGENKELVQEVVAIAKRHGIATPYTSYLIVPDAPMRITATGLPKTAPAPVKAVVPPPQRPDVRLVQPSGQIGQIGQFGQFGAIGGSGQIGGQFGQFGGQLGGLSGQFGGQLGGQIGGQFGQFGQLGFNGTVVPGQSVTGWARKVQTKPGELSKNRGDLEEERLKEGDSDLKILIEARSKKAAYDQAFAALARKQQLAVQTGSLGVDLSIDSNKLSNAQRLTLSPLHRVAGRICLEIGGVWIDEDYDAKMQTVIVKAMSDAYFALLESHPELSEVFQLGNYVIWITPSKTALVIDLGEGKETLTKAEIDGMFVMKK